MIIAFLVGFGLIAGGVLVYRNSDDRKIPDLPEPVLGADRDVHGCIGSAGYSWCEEKNKCLRIWEEECSPSVKKDEDSFVVPPSVKPCVVTGCSGQICAEEQIVSTCEWSPIYACYKGAKCERQKDGKCGWTDNPGFRECLNRGGLDN